MIHPSPAKLGTRIAAFILDYLLVFALLMLILLRFVFPVFHPGFLESLEEFVNAQHAEDNQPELRETLQRQLEFQNKHERAIADSQFLYVALLWIYFAASEIIMQGSTLGKKIFKLRTIDLITFTTPSGKAILIRNFIKTVSISVVFPILLIINAIYPFFNSRRLSGHDRLSKTIVVREDILSHIESDPNQTLVS